MAIEGIGNGFIMNNTMSGAQGTFGFSCTISANYTAHFYAPATIQPGSLDYWFFDDRCGSWNDSLPQPDDPGALAHGRQLLPNQSKWSSAGNYQLIYQGDGNLVLKDASGNPVWAEPGSVGNPAVALMQEDANFVVYDGPCTWHTHTNNPLNQGAYLVVQNDGNVVVYFLDGAGECPEFRV